MNAPEVSPVTATDLTSRTAPAPVQVERGTVKYLRVLEEVARPWAARKQWHKDDGDGMAHSALGEGHLGLKVQHGIVPVEADGSANFVVPADRAIYLQALDENLMAIQTERTYVNYKPGETRSCIGCHETPGYAPAGAPSPVPLATTRPPSVPMPQPHETSGRKLFDYDRQIQPIWDRHCVQCHNDETSEAGLNLIGRAEGPYCVSYNQLIRLGKSDKQLLGNRRLRAEDTGSLRIIYIPPYMLGALSSPLASWLSGGKFTLYDADLQGYAEHLGDVHPDVGLTDAELLAVTNWLDVNCPYHPSYWGRLNAKYAGHPNYRPEVTFDEARMRTVPESIGKNEADRTLKN
jgi:cytochrome c553